MQAGTVEQIRWAEVGIVCPHCGNSGSESGTWNAHALVPFKLVENVVRSFVFAPRRDGDGSLVLLADVETDAVDWESGSDLRLECMQCFGDFPIPAGAEIDFD